MKISLKQSDTFIPDYDDNLTLPEDKQIKFHYRFLGSATRTQYEYLEDIQITQEIVEGSQQVGKRKLIQDSKGMALAMVTKIENLEIEYVDNDVKKVEQVTDIHDFYKRSLPGLAQLLEAHCLSATSEVNPKN